MKTKNLKCGRYKTKNHGKRIQGKMLNKKQNFRIMPVAIVLIFIFVICGFFSPMFLGLKSLTTLKDLKAEAQTLPYKAMVVMETNKNRVLDGYNEETKLPMASTTKIITAIVAIENCNDLEQRHTIPDASVGIEGSSMYLRWGEELSIKELLYGLMLPSGNDSAVALSILIGGSEENFVKMMNNFVGSLGLKNTHLTNPHGLHSDNHYTTAKDLAIITSYAMKNEIFKEIVGTKFVEIKGSEPNKPRYLKSKQHLMDDKDLIDNGITITGVKTGYTPEAGRCLVTSANIPSGIEIVSVVLNAPDMFVTSKELILKNKEKVKLTEILAPKQHIGKLEVLKGDKLSINTYSEAGFLYPLTDEEVGKVKINYNYNSSLIAPIKKGEIVGEIEVVIDDKSVFKTPIYSLDEVNSTDLKSKIREIVEQFF